MNQPDNSSQTTETPCVENQLALRIAPEQLRRLLIDHRSNLQKRCFEMRQTAMRIEKDIASIDALLAELTTR